LVLPSDKPTACSAPAFVETSAGEWKSCNSVGELDSSRTEANEDPNPDDISPETGDSNSSLGNAQKPTKVDMKAKLERSRQSARECRARKKLRYQYLEDLVNKKERTVLALRHEIDLVGSHSFCGSKQSIAFY
jgi:hypothetical protein